MQKSIAKLLENGQNNNLDIKKTAEKSSKR